MRQIDNWDAIEERQPGDYALPVPGGYIAQIKYVEDKEDKEYLAIEWDFAEGAYQGANQATYDRAGFWPTILRRSYKESALGFFKGFKSAVEASNPGYHFDCRQPAGLEGRYVGVVLGEEEYRKKDGSTGTRLYVWQTRAVKAIREGDYKVPEKKHLEAVPDTMNSTGAGFPEVSDDDGELPF